MSWLVTLRNSGSSWNLSTADFTGAVKNYLSFIEWTKKESEKQQLCWYPSIIEFQLIKLLAGRSNNPLANSIFPDFIYQLIVTFQVTKLLSVSTIRSNISLSKPQPCHICTTRPSKLITRRHFIKHLQRKLNLTMSGIPINPKHFETAKSLSNTNLAKPMSQNFTALSTKNQQKYYQIHSLREIWKAEKQTPF
jgi:hypothetical protein